MGIMTENKVLEYLENLHFKILRNSFAKNVTENEISALVECKNLATEIQKYRAIGTVEECREAREKQRGKKPIEYEDKYYGCPICDNILMFKWEKYPTHLKDKKDGLPYCLSCGQAIDWSEDEH